MSGIPGGRVVGAFGPQQGVCGKKMQYANLHYIADRFQWAINSQVHSPSKIRVELKANET